MTVLLIMLGMMLMFVGFRVIVNKLNGVYNFQYTIPFMIGGLLIIMAGAWIFIDTITGPGI